MCFRSCGFFVLSHSCLKRSQVLKLSKLALQNHKREYPEYASRLSSNGSNNAASNGTAMMDARFRPSTPNGPDNRVSLIADDSLGFPGESFEEDFPILSLSGPMTGYGF